MDNDEPVEICDCTSLLDVWRHYMLWKGCFLFAFFDDALHWRIAVRNAASHGVIQHPSEPSDVVSLSMNGGALKDSYVRLLRF